MERSGGARPARRFGAAIDGGRLSETLQQFDILGEKRRLCVIERGIAAARVTTHFTSTQMCALSYEIGFLQYK